MTRVFRNREEAEAEGFFVSTICYPWSAYNRATPPERQGDVRTDLEARLGEVLGRLFNVADEVRQNGHFASNWPPVRHAFNDAEAALRAFRGEGERG